MSKKNRDRNGPHVNIYASPSSRRGNREKERDRGSRPGVFGLNRTDDRERRVFPQLAAEYWNLPKEIVLEGVLWKYDSPVPVTEERQRVIPAYYNWLGQLVPAERVTEKVQIGYRGSYVKEREMSWGEQRQRERDAEAQKRREARKNRPLVEKLRSGAPLWDRKY